jgi:hypothetical protein
MVPIKFALWISVLPACSLTGSAQSAGVLAEWDARKMIDAVTTQAQHLKPVIQQVKPDDFLQRGAPAAYVEQLRVAQKELGYFLSAAETLSKQPDRLTLALDAYFRMLTLESTVGSVIEGVRKYQNPALAELLQNAVNENTTNRDKLRQYIQDLAAEKEQELRVADQEAQRCRTSILKQPAPGKKVVRK